MIEMLVYGEGCLCVCVVSVEDGSWWLEVIVLVLI